MKARPGVPPFGLERAAGEPMRRRQFITRSVRGGGLASRAAQQS